MLNSLNRNFARPNSGLRQTYHQLVVRGNLVLLPSWLRSLVPQLASVSGDSMEPTLRSGDWVVVARTPRRGPRLGQVVVVEHPDRPGFELVKRVSALSRERHLLWVAGDNRSSSTDSDDFGPLGQAALRGVVLVRVRPGPWRWLRPDPGRLR
ncbi:MAG: nickel-type superoxide dismutase maturation protease [Candidatus Dormiibacterota bacterium]